MNNDDIVWRLAQLASLPFQERYVIGGTSDEYVLDTELIENVDSLKDIVRRYENPMGLTEAQRAALEILFLYIDIHSEEALSAGSRDEGAVLIRESKVWRELRGKSALALETFAISVNGMSPEEIIFLYE